MHHWDRTLGVSCQEQGRAGTPLSLPWPLSALLPGGEAVGQGCRAVGQGLGCRQGSVLHCSPGRVPAQLLHCPRSGPQHPGSPHGSLQIWGVPIHKPPPSEASTSPVRGTDRQAAIPCRYTGTGAHDNTGSTPTATAPCAANGLRKGLLHHPETPFMHLLPGSLPAPGHRGQIQPLPSAVWARALTACSAHPKHLPATPHSTRHPCQHPPDTAQLLGVTGILGGALSPAALGTPKTPCRQLYPNRATSKPGKPQARQG